MKYILAKVKGSVLAYSLILLTIVLIASIGMMSSSIVNFRSVSTSDKSGNAFQVADSGAQAVIVKIKANPDGEIRDLGSCSNSGGSASIAETSFLGGEYRLSFYGGDGSEALNCNDDIADITSVKSVGTYSDTTRAVQVAVAQVGGGGITGGCKMNGINISERWGSGCLSSGNATSATCAGAQANNFQCGPSAIVSGETFCLCTND